MSGLRHRSALALTLAGMFLARTAPCQTDDVSDETRNSAREIGRDGVVAYEAGKYAEALDLLRRAYAMVPAPSIALYEARSLAKLGRVVEAVERYELVRRTPLEADAPQAFRDAVSEASSEIAGVRARIPRLNLSVSGAGADSRSLEVQLDGKPYPAALLGVDGRVDPGRHVAVARVQGVSRAEQKFELEEGKSYVIALRLIPLDDGTPATNAPEQKSLRSGGISQRTWGWLSVGVGGSSVVFGAVAALTARSKQGDLDAACSGNVCPESARAQYDEVRRWSTISYVGYGVGVVGLGVGAALLFTARDEKKPSTARISPWVSLGSAGVAGRF